MFYFRSERFCPQGLTGKATFQDRLYDLWRSDEPEHRVFALRV